MSRLARQLLYVQASKQASARSQIKSDVLAFLLRGLLIEIVSFSRLDHVEVFVVQLPILKFHNRIPLSFILILG